VVLVVATLTSTETSEIHHKLDRFDPFDLLEAQFILAAQSQRRAVEDADRLSIHLIGQDREMVRHVFDKVDVVIFASLGTVRQ